MSALIWFSIWALLIFLVMRFGCGAHIMGSAYDEAAQRHEGSLKWEPPETDTDPVCGKTVTPADVKPSVFGGLVYYFCSRECREAFEAAPGLYAGGKSLAGQGKLEGHHG